MKTRAFIYPNGFTLDDLLELGRRLDEDQLRDIGLRLFVLAATREAYWRIMAANELLQPFRNDLTENVIKMTEQVRKQLVDPVRETPIEVGNFGFPGKRSLPKAGSLLVTTYERSPQGGKKNTQTFRFVVIDPRGKLLRLRDPKGNIIYRSLSAAACTATGNLAMNGWEFFGDIVNYKM